MAILKIVHIRHKGPFPRACHSYYLAVSEGLSLTNHLFTASQLVSVLSDRLQDSSSWLLQVLKVVIVIVKVDAIFLLLSDTISFVGRKC